MSRQPGMKRHSIFMMHGSVGERLDHERRSRERMAFGVGKSDPLCDSRTARNITSSPKLWRRSKKCIGET